MCEACRTANPSLVSKETDGYASLAVREALVRTRTRNICRVSVLERR